MVQSICTEGIERYLPIGNVFPMYLRLRTTAQIRTLQNLKKIKKFWSFIKSLKKDAFGITSLRENGILKTDAKEKTDICNRQF